MKFFNFPEHGAQNAAEGAICVCEEESSAVPFDIKRVYYTYGVQKGIVRGHHAHKKLEQLLICVSGEIEITLDNGEGEIESVTLNTPSRGLYVGPSVWHTMKWLKDDSVLLVLASDHYNEADYIRNYDNFIKWVKKGEKNEHTL